MVDRADFGRTAFNSNALFRSGSSIETLSIRDLLKWSLTEAHDKLCLPPIQRSLVWSNAQIINFWDSLLRGYPPGMMMVHRSTKADDHAWSLFDGQQRLATLLLGLGQGDWGQSRKLWVDLGLDPSLASGLKYQLRISSAGQPFGYSAATPNEKIGLGERKSAWSAWEETGLDRKAAFERVQGEQIIGARRAIPFSAICKEFWENPDLTFREMALGELTDEELRRQNNLVAAIAKVFDSKIIITLVDEEIFSDPSEYIRLFGRVGQGGTRLSNDELTYSIIKHRYPGIREPLEKIGKGEAGRLVDDVNLVLGALRVSKTLAPPEGKNDWEISSRPTPAFVLEMKDWVETEKYFLSLILPAAKLCEPNTNMRSVLEKALISLRQAIVFRLDNVDGFPPILLGRLPNQLVDVLVLFTLKSDSHQSWRSDEKNTLIAFSLYWLIFVNNEDRAALLTFQCAFLSEWAFSPGNVQRLVSEFEKKGAARPVLRADEIQNLRDGLESQPGARVSLRAWADRFKESDHHDTRKPGEAVRVLSTNPERIRRALMWLQREYLTKDEFANYDPTSDRDEDLPIDLDHLVPHARFGGDWRNTAKQIDDQTVNANNFRDNRYTVGNSLGNYRWLSVSDNRSRQDGELDEGELSTTRSFVSNLTEWNGIIRKNGETARWNAADVATFQRLIDTRTLDLYENLLKAIEPVLPKFDPTTEDRAPD